MAALKKPTITKEPDAFIFKETVSSIPLKKASTGRDIEQELFGKKGQMDIVNDLEKELGYKKKVSKPANIKYHNVLLNPADDTDQELLNQLLNDKEVFNIKKWSEFSTNRTGFQIFVIYTEDLDALEKIKKDKELNESTKTSRPL